MRHYLLTRSAYGPGWSLEANQRRLEITRGIMARSVKAQTERRFDWFVLLHRGDPLIKERRRAFAGARFLYIDVEGSASLVASRAYKAGWAEAIGPRDEVVAMTRLDDDDALAPWVMDRIRRETPKIRRRAVLMFPSGIRVWSGRFTVVRHTSNAMQTLVTMPGDELTVYDYQHRYARKVAPVKMLDARIAWLWSRHPDTISGWRVAQHRLSSEWRALFPVDWSLFGEPVKGPRSPAGRIFR